MSFNLDKSFFLCNFAPCNQNQEEKFLLINEKSLNIFIMYHSI